MKEKMHSDLPVKGSGKIFLLPYSKEHLKCSIGALIIVLFERAFEIIYKSLLQVFYILLNS